MKEYRFLNGWFLPALLPCVVMSEANCGNCRCHNVASCGKSPQAIAANCGKSVPAIVRFLPLRFTDLL